MTHKSSCKCLVPRVLNDMQEIVTTPGVDPSARWLAAVHFKNTVSKAWRPRLPGALSEEEKSLLRPTMLSSLLDQESAHIATQTSLALAKVARVDYPKSWPSLIADLFSRWSTASTSRQTLTERRCCLALHNILKELASKRLAGDRSNFSALAEQLVGQLREKWCADTTAVLAYLEDTRSNQHAAVDEPKIRDFLSLCECWVLELKCLRRLLVVGYASDATTMEPVPAVADLAPAMVHASDAIINALSGIQSAALSAESLYWLNRGCLALVKTLYRLVEVHPWSMLACGTTIKCLHRACVHIEGLSPGGSLSLETSTKVRTVALQLCTLVRRSPSYKGSASSLSIPPSKGRDVMARLKELSQRAAPVLEEFWNSATQPLLRIIVITILPLTPDELDGWDTEGGYALHQTLTCAPDGQGELSLRGSAEMLLMAMLDAPSPPAPHLLLDVLSSCRAEATSSITLQAATFRAAALGANALCDVIDFGSWVRSPGGPLEAAMTTSPAARPIRREALGVLGAWAAHIPPTDRGPVYQALTVALGDDDPAIFLPALGALRANVEDWEFSPQDFTPYIAQCLTHITKIVGGTGEGSVAGGAAEAASLLDALLARTFTGSETTILPHVDALLNITTAAWAASEGISQADGQSAVKIQLMVLLQRLVHALGPASQAVHPFLSALLTSVLCQDNSEELMEDALLLWLVALKHAPSHSSSSGLLAPLPHLLSVMAASTEHLTLACRILSSAILLAPVDVLGGLTPQITSVLHSYVGTVNERGIQHLMALATLIVRVLPTVLASNQVNLCQNVLGCLDSFLLTLLMDVILCPLSSNDLSNKSSTNSVLVVRDFIVLNSFVALISHDLRLLPNLVQGWMGLPGTRFAGLIELWASALLTSITDMESRKACAIALTLVCCSVPAQAQWNELGNEASIPLRHVVEGVVGAWWDLEGGPDAHPEDIGVEELAARFVAKSGRDEDLPLAVDVSEAEGESVRRQQLIRTSPAVTYGLVGPQTAQLLRRVLTNGCLEGSGNGSEKEGGGGGGGDESGLRKRVHSMLTACETAAR